MNIFWNILWIFPFFGWIWAILYGILGLCVCATIVGLPIGLGLLQYSKFLFWPHGNAMISKSDLEVITEKERPLWWKIFAMIVRILYFPFGLINAILGTLYGFVCFITIIGIPEGLVMMKSIGTLFNPINKVMVPAALRDEIERVKAMRRYSPSSKSQASSVNSTPFQQPPAIPQPSFPKIASDNTDGGFCNKCGSSLPYGSAFCPKCGTAVVVGVEEEVKYDSNQPTQHLEDNANTIQSEILESKTITSPKSINPVTSSMSLVSSDSENLDNSQDQKKKILIFCGLGLSVIAIAIAVCVIWARKGEDKVSYVLAESATLYKSVEDGNGVEYLKDLAYGTPVEYSDYKDDNSGWVKVSVKEADKTIHGFIHSGVLVDKADFEKVDRAGFNDIEIRSSAVSAAFRNAIVQALNNKDQWWHLEKMDYEGGSGELNGKSVIVRGASPSERCFAFVLANDSAKWNRELYVYSFTESDDPVFLYNENIDDKYGRFRDVSIKNGQFKTLYEKTDPKVWLEIPVYEPIYGDSNIEGEQEKEKQFGGAAEMSGFVDGKYPVKMELTMHPDHTVTGTVTYTKYNVPMGLTGTYTDRDGSYDLSLDETSNGEVTGNFIGSYDGLIFSGSWVKPDGSKEMPFRVER
ncbi:MAG: hypothetical protein K2L22_03320 [Muribaculaceae bacterium]|nr:hypothetical protein [Muribaculaceae bacterium]